MTARLNIARIVRFEIFPWLLVKIKLPCTIHPYQPAAENVSTMLRSSRQSLRLNIVFELFTNAFVSTKPFSTLSVSKHASNLPIFITVPNLLFITLLRKYMKTVESDAGMNLVGGQNDISQRVFQINNAVIGDSHSAVLMCIRFLLFFKNSVRKLLKLTSCCFVLI